MPARSIRVLVVEDFEPFRRFVESILRKQPESISAGNADRLGRTSAASIRYCASLNPHSCSSFRSTKHEGYGFLLKRA